MQSERLDVRLWAFKLECGLTASSKSRLSDHLLLLIWFLDSLHKGGGFSKSLPRSNSRKNVCRIPQ